MSRSTQPDTARSSGTRLDTGLLLIVAMTLYGLSVVSSSPGAGLAVTFATAVAGLAYSMWIRREEPNKQLDPEYFEIRLFGAVLIFAVLGTLGWAPSWIGETTGWLEGAPGVVWAILAFAVFSTRQRDNQRPVFIAVAGAVLLVTLIAGILHLDGARGIGVDVYLLHKGAAQAIADGQNPYTDVVEVPNGAPTAAPGETIVGYPYPPIVGIAFSLGQWTLEDPRFTGLASWLAVLGMVGVSAYRRLDRRRLYVLLLLASIPGWPLVLRAGWTEPLSLALLTAAFLTWHRPVGSGVALGLSLGSKQYFALVAPLVLLHRDSVWLRRLVVTAAVLALAIVPVALWDPSAFWSAAVEFHTNTPWRTDSVNVIGAIGKLTEPWIPPRWLGPALGVGASLAVGWFSRTRATFFLGMAVALAVSFLASSQAFANYWFLISGLVALSLIAHFEESQQDTGMSESSAISSASTGLGHLA